MAGLNAKSSVAVLLLSAVVLIKMVAVFPVLVGVPGDFINAMGSRFAVDM